jgi:outer membrane biogenesis lipoprotein LolB
MQKFAELCAYEQKMQTVSAQLSWQYNTESCKDFEIFGCLSQKDFEIFGYL